MFPVFTFAGANLVFAPTKVNTALVLSLDFGRAHIFSTEMSLFRKSSWSLVLAIALCGSAWAVKLALDKQIGELTPFLLFFGAIILATWHGGLVIGVFATLLSALLANYFFLPPPGAFDLSSLGLVQCAVFILEGFFISLLTARARAAQDGFREQVERQSALSELSQLALAHVDGLDIVFARAAQMCAQRLNVSDVVLWELVRPESLDAADYFEARAALGESSHVGDKAPFESALARAMRQGFPIRDGQGRVTGELKVPIGPVDKSWGVLQIGAKEKHLWSNEQIAWVRALSGVLGVAIAGHNERQRAAQGETRYRSFVEQSSEAIWRFEMDEPISLSQDAEEVLELCWQYGYLAECNDAFARMYGFDFASEMIGMRLWQIMDRDDDGVRAYLLDLIGADFRVSDAESVEADRDGNTRIFLNNLTGIIENGRLLRVWGTQRDVTLQRAAQSELRQSENRFRSLFDAAPVPLGIGREQSVLYVNRALCELLGYDAPQAMIGRPITDFVAPEERAQIAARARNRASGASEPMIYQSRVQRRDGSVFPAHLEMAQIQLPEGAATLMFLFDLTQQKQADASIARLLDEAQDATVRAENLQQISFDLLRARAPETAANVAIERVTRAVGARGGVLMAPDDINNPQLLQALGSRGYPPGVLERFFSIAIDSDHPMTHVFRTREMLWMDVAADWVERFPSLAETLPRTGTKSIAILPLEAEGRVVSVMALSWSEARAFNEESRLFLQTLANSCAQSLEHARLDTQARDLARSQQESLALLNTLLESAPVGFALFDRDHRYLLVNGALARINGRAIEEHLDKTVEEVLGESESEFERRLTEVWRSGQASGEFVLTDEKDGEQRFCLTSLYPVRVERDGEESAELLGVGAIVLDISERERAEEEKSRLVSELESESTRLEAVLRQMPSAVIIAEAPSGRMLLSNSHVDPLIGKPVALDNINDYGAYNAFWPDGRRLKANDWPLARALEKGEIVKDEEITVPDETGNRVLRITASPIRDRDGKITAGVAIFDDVTRRARDEAAQRFLADVGSALIATLDGSSAHERLANVCVPEVADWCILAIPGEDGLLHHATISHIAGEANDDLARRLQQQFAIDAAVPWDVAGVLWSGRAQLYPTHDREYLERIQVSAEYGRLIEEIGVRSAIVAPLAARGRTLGLMIWITANSGRIYDAHDLDLAEELARRAALTTDNARLFAEAQQARDEAQAANLAKDEFLAVVSHELRTPLTPILGWLDLLRAPGIDEEMRVQAYKVIERNARAQAQLVNDILDVSRITSGKLRIATRPTDFTKLVRDAVESLRLSADEKGVALQLDLQEVGGAQLDSNRFQQVVWNLLSNAIKFTPAGGQITIALARSDENSAMLEMSDSGQGIASHFVANVFEAFRQADSSSTRKTGGLGLGLAIVRHIVEMHGGRVSAHSAGEGQGATFRVWMPLLSAPIRPTVSETAPGDGDFTGANSLRGARILLIDDEADTRETLSRLLESYGARVRVAASAAQALKTLDVFTPQLAISDIGMPDVDGYELLGQLRARLPELPAIALTAYTAPADIERAKAAGFQNHIAKPVEASELIEASGALLSEPE